MPDGRSDPAAGTCGAPPSDTTSSRQNLGGSGSASVAPRRAAVLGSPISHSLSPRLHRAAYDALGLAGWSYDAIECDVAGFDAMLGSLGNDVVGLSCTMPLKHAALAVAAQRSRAAETVGAANTLIPVNDGWYADNTDVDGVIGALAEAGVTAPRSALVLGAGGTAQAVLMALAQLGTAAVTVAAREPARAHPTLGRTSTAASVPIVVEALTTVVDFSPFDLVVSTLPGEAAAPYARGFGAPDAIDPIDPASDRSADGSPGALLDVVYDPWPTTLATAARAAGRTVVGGRAMLLHQAARQVELMTGRPAPVDAMRAALSI